MGRSGPSDDLMVSNGEFGDRAAKDMDFYNKPEPEIPTTTGGLEESEDESDNDDDDMGNEDDGYRDNPTVIADLCSLANSIRVEEQALILAKDDEGLADLRTSSPEYCPDVITQGIEDASDDDDNNADTNMDLDRSTEQLPTVQQAFEGRWSMTLPVRNRLTRQISGPDNPHPGSQTPPFTSKPTDQYHGEGLPKDPITLDGNESRRPSLDIHRSDDVATHLANPIADDNTGVDARPSFETSRSERLDTIHPVVSRPVAPGLEERKFPQDAVYLPVEDDAANYDIYEEYRDHNGRIPLVSAADYAFLHERVFNRQPESDLGEQSEAAPKIPLADHAQDEVSADSAPAEGKAGVVHFVSENSLRATALAQAQTAYHSTLPDNVHRVQAEEAAKIHLASDSPIATSADDHRRFRNRRRAQSHEITQIQFADDSPAATPATPVDNHRWLRKNHRMQSHETPRIHFADSAAVAPATPVDNHRWFGKHRRVQSEDIHKKGSTADSAPAEGEADDVKKQLRRKRPQSMPHKMPNEKENPEHGFFSKMESIGREFGEKVKHLGQSTAAHFKHTPKSTGDIEEQPLGLQQPSTPVGLFPAFSDPPMEERTTSAHTPQQHEPKSTFARRLRGRLSLSNVFRWGHHDHNSPQLPPLAKPQPHPFTIAERHRRCSSPPLPAENQTSPSTPPRPRPGTPRSSPPVERQPNQIRTPSPQLFRTRQLTLNAPRFSNPLSSPPPVRGSARQLVSGGRYSPNPLSSAPPVRAGIAPHQTIPEGQLLMMTDAYNVSEYLPGLCHPGAITRRVSSVNRALKARKISGGDGFPFKTVKSKGLDDVPYEPGLKRSELDKMHRSVWERCSTEPLAPAPSTPKKKKRVSSAEPPMTPKRMYSPGNFSPEPSNLAKRHNGPLEWKSTFAPHEPSLNTAKNIVDKVIRPRRNTGRCAPSFTLPHNAAVDGITRDDSESSNASTITPQKFMATTRKRAGTLVKGVGNLLHLHHNRSHSSPPKMSEHGRSATVDPTGGKDGVRKRRVTFASEPQSHAARKHNRHHATPFSPHRVREASPTRGSFQPDENEETSDSLRQEAERKIDELMRRNNLRRSEKPHVWREQISQINPRSFTHTVADPILPVVRHGVPGIRPSFMALIRDHRLDNDREKHNVIREACLNTDRMQDKVVSHAHPDPEVEAARIGNQRRANPDVVEFERRTAANIAQVARRGGNDFMIASLENSAAERRGLNLGSQARCHPSPGVEIPNRMTRDRRDADVERQKHTELAVMDAGPEMLRRLQEEERRHSDIMCYAQPHPDQFGGAGPFAQAQRIHQDAADQTRRITALHHLPNSARGVPIGRQVSESESRGYRDAVLYRGQGHRALHHMRSYSRAQELKAARVASQAAANHHAASLAQGDATEAEPQTAAGLDFAGLARVDTAGAGLGCC